MTIWTKEQEAEALRKRFDSLKKEKGISRAAFARSAGIKGGDSMINQHITGHRPLSKDAAIAYAKGFGCTLFEISPRLASEAEELAAFIDGKYERVDSKPDQLLLSTVATIKPATERDAWLAELSSLASQLDLPRIGMLVQRAQDLIAEMPAKQTRESLK